MKVKKRVKKKEHEKLTDANIAKVISLLENSKNPITKKDACDILNISYNTTRLGTIIENFKDEKELAHKRKQQKRGKPADPSEIRAIIEGILDGDPVSDIAKRIYRNTTFVNNVSEKIGIPKKVQGEEKYKVEFLPEECVAEDFEVGEIAWSAVYHKPCEIRGLLDSELLKKKYLTKCYRIYVIEKMEELSPYFPSIDSGGFFAYSASYDLGKLKHLENLGLDTSKL